MSDELTTDQKRLALRKPLLFHNYDLFLERLTRLYTFACATGEPDFSEVSSKRELLLLDDLTIFAITARRLIEGLLASLRPSRSAKSDSRSEPSVLRGNANPIRRSRIRGY
jgi:hypothetical protein